MDFIDRIQFYNLGVNTVHGRLAEAGAPSKYLEPGSGKIFTVDHVKMKIEGDAEPVVVADAEVSGQIILVDI